MPNWCFNNMDIHGDRDELQRFVDATKQTKEDGSFSHGLNHLFPVPEELSETTAGSFSDAAKQAELTKKEEANTKKYGFKNWYDWANDPSNWGTKWGACDFDWRSFDDDNHIVGPNESFISAYYESAWGPADGLILNISEIFPELIFSVISTEESDAFACYSIFRDGYTLAQDGETPSVPKAIVDMFNKDDEGTEKYEALTEWQTQVFDRWFNEADHALRRIIIKK